MIKKFLMLILLLFTVNSAFADVFDNPSSVEKIVSEVPKFGDVTCKFKQEKTMPNSSAVLKSGGDFQFTKNKGAFFKTTYPIDSVSNYSSSENKQINDIILSISNQDYSRVKKNFDLFFEKQKNGNWILGLRPKKDSRPGKHLQNIVIQGKKNINIITVSTIKAGKTKMFFDCD